MTIFEPSGAKSGSYPAAIRFTAVPSEFITYTDGPEGPPLSVNAILDGYIDDPGFVTGGWVGTSPLFASQPVSRLTSITMAVTACEVRFLRSSMSLNVFHARD